MTQENVVLGPSHKPAVSMERPKNGQSIAWRQRIIARTKMLEGELFQQQQLFKKSQDGMQTAMANIHKLQGALEDCQFFMAEACLDEQMENRFTPIERGNGFAEKLMAAE